MPRKLPDAPHGWVFDMGDELTAEVVPYKPGQEEGGLGGWHDRLMLTPYPTREEALKAFIAFLEEGKRRHAEAIRREKAKLRRWTKT